MRTQVQIVTFAYQTNKQLADEKQLLLTAIALNRRCISTSTPKLQW
jgi:hypothetical protein